MTISSVFKVGGVAVTGACSTTYGATVSLAVTSVAGIGTITWNIVGCSDASVVHPVITPAGTPGGATATFVVPADQNEGKGLSFLVQCYSSDGLGNTSTVRAVVGVPNDAGLIPGVAGETTERDATVGWTEVVNAALADNITGAVTVTMAGGVGDTLVATIPLSAATVYTFGFRCVSNETAGGTDLLVREWTATFARKTAGAAAQLGADSDGGIYQYADDAAWVAKAILNANSLELRVTNDAAHACKSRFQWWLYSFATI